MAEDVVYSFPLFLIGYAYFHISNPIEGWNHHQ